MSVSNRTARLWLASVFIVLAAAATLYRALAEPSLGWRFAALPSAGVVAEPVDPQRIPLQGVTSIEGNGARCRLPPHF